MATVQVRDWKDWSDFSGGCQRESSVVSSLLHKEGNYSGDTKFTCVGWLEDSGSSLEEWKTWVQWGLGILEELPWEGNIRFDPTGLEVGHVGEKP